MPNESEIDCGTIISDIRVCPGYRFHLVTESIPIIVFKNIGQCYGEIAFNGDIVFIPCLYPNRVRRWVGFKVKVLVLLRVPLLSRVNKWL